MSWVALLFSNVAFAETPEQTVFMVENGWLVLGTATDVPPALQASVDTFTAASELPWEQAEPVLMAGVPAEPVALDVQEAGGVKVGDRFVVGEQTCSVEGFAVSAKGFANDYWSYGCSYMELQAKLSCDTTEPLAVREGTVYPTVFALRDATEKEAAKASKAFEKTAEYKEVLTRLQGEAATLGRPLEKSTEVRAWTGGMDLFEVHITLKTGDDYMCGGDDAYEDYVGWFDKKGKLVVPAGSGNGVRAVYDVGRDGTLDFEFESGNPWGRYLTLDGVELKTTDGSCMCGC